jgi:hypothetical protein
MERQVWLAERRAALVAGYNADAASYGDDEYPWDMQREWVARVLALIPPGATVLDAPCGTGKYFAMLAVGPIGPGSDQPGAHAPGRGRCARGEVEFAEDVGQVPVYGVLAQHQLPGDVGVAQALRDELEHVELARRQDRHGLC